jgi:hypothetical protein
MASGMVAFHTGGSLLTPLWPAGHLPLKGGDQRSLPRTPTFDLAEWSQASMLPISPLEGEMAGRPEGGASNTACRRRAGCV